jgi:hypothetical protein
MEVIAYIVLLLVVMPGLLYLCGYLVDKYTGKRPGWIHSVPREKPHGSPRAPATDRS